MVIHSSSHDVTASRIRNSSTYRTWRQAFVEISGLPLFLESGASLLSSASDETNPCEEPNPFCCIVNLDARSCLRCTLGRMPPLPSVTPRTVHKVCRAGMQSSAVPVLAGNLAVAWIVTGQVNLENTGLTEPVLPPAATRTLCDEQVIEILANHGEHLRDAHRRSPRMSRCHYQRMIALLECIGSWLGGLLNAIFIETSRDDSCLVAQVKAALRDQTESGEPEAPFESSLSTGRASIHSLFERETGMRLAEFTHRCRLERARRALLASGGSDVHDVAQSCGYPDKAAFERDFVTFLLETPDSYQFRMQSCFNGLSSWPEIPANLFGSLT